MAIKYLEHKDLRSQLQRLSRAGGQSQKAAERVHVIRGRIRDGERDPFHGVPTTNHGESRIKDCVKFDLSGFCRLVTIQSKNLIVLRFVGDHATVDRWLDNNRGLITVLSDSNQLIEIRVSQDVDKPNRRVAYQPDNYFGPILNRLDQNYRARLFGDLPSRITEPLRDLHAGIPEDAIHSAVARVPDESARKLIFDVLVLLNSGDIQGAENRIDLENSGDGQRKFTLVENLSEDQILNIRDGEVMRQIQIGSVEYESWIERYQRSVSELDWFLFMHPEQEKFVVADYSGPAKLSGVSGSGKTCIAIRRAVRLASKYPNHDIAIITLNRSLAALIQKLIDHVCPESQGRNRIKVYSFFGLCQELLAEFEPTNTKLYRDVTWRLEEHIDEIFREYYRCRAAYTKADVLKPLHRALTSLGFDAEAYLREEFDWIRSAVPFEDRQRYAEIERTGRGYPIDKARREIILEALRFWEEKMQAVGVIDYLGLTTALSRHRKLINPRFRRVIVDEVQDFGTSELEIIRKLVRSAENDIFLCGDLAQQILPKHQTFSGAGIEVSGRAHSIRRNYRNTREILKAAYEVLIENLDESMMLAGEMEILDPEYATRSSSTPAVLKGDSLAHELACARALMLDNAAARRERGEERPHRGCIVIAGFSLYELSIFGEEHGVSVLDGSRDLSDGEIFLSDLEQTKGYEFDTVAILNCASAVLPPIGSPPEEAYRFGCQLYVAMTRARDQLVLSYSGAPSRWLNLKSSALYFDDWANFIEVAESDFVGRPGFLSELPDSEDINQAVMDLTGKDFNYTVFARGLSSEVQDRIEELVDGRGMLRGGTRVRWATIAQLYDDMRMPGRTGYIFGPVADKVVFESLEAASRGDRVVAKRKVKERSINLKPLRSPSKTNIDRTNVNNNAISDFCPSKLSESIRKLDIEPESMMALEKKGIKLIGELLSTRSLHLLRSPAFGSKNIEQIRNALKARGYKW